MISGTVVMDDVRAATQLAGLILRAADFHVQSTLTARDDLQAAKEIAQVC